MLEILQMFLTVAECGSFSETAKRLYCSQPTISKQIRQLEETFGVPLFHRSGKHVKLTRQGEILLRYGQQASHLLAEAARLMKEESQNDERMTIFSSHFRWIDEWDAIHSSIPGRKYQADRPACNR